MCFEFLDLNDDGVVDSFESGIGYLMYTNIVNKQSEDVDDEFSDEEFDFSIDDTDNDDW